MIDQQLGILQRAERIARIAHAGQKEQITGDDYIEHVKRVVALVDGEDAKTVAWLHDVIEDAPVTTDSLRKAGIPERIITSVWHLSRRIDEESYAEYIQRIKASGDPLALAVKLADLKDHLRDSCPARLRARYEAALIALAPKGVSS
jgi:(p)ppGpp synthase/HD superfamily hydrolase